MGRTGAQRDRVARVGGKIAVPRHRMQARTSADAQERALERVTRRAGRAACAEGWHDYLEEKEDDDEVCA